MDHFIESTNDIRIPYNLYKKFGVTTLFPKVELLPYKEVKEFVRKLNLKNVREWYRYCRSGKKPNNIPSNPDQVYKNKGWLGWADFLGY